MKHVLSLIGKEVRDEERHERRIKNRKVEKMKINFFSIRVCHRHYTEKAILEKPVHTFFEQILDNFSYL